MDHAVTEHKFLYVGSPGKHALGSSYCMKSHFTGAHECCVTSCLSLPKQRHLNGGSGTNSNMWQGRSETCRLKKAGRVNVSSDG